MKVTRMLAFAAVFAFSLAAQTGTVRGLVRSASDGAPLPGAEVSLAGSVASSDGTAASSGGDAYAESVRTGADGRFLFPGLAPGPYVMGIQKSGYEAGVRVSRSVEINADGDQVDVPVDLRRSAAVSGRVVDPDGDPAPNAAVVAAEWDTSRGRRTLRQIQAGHTDDLGEFRLHGLAAGPYVIAVYPIQLPAPKGVLAFDLAAQYYPNASAPAGAAPLRLAWGDERQGLEFQLDWSAATALEGSVQDEDGAACTDCIVTATADDSPAPQVVAVNDQGLFAIRGAAPGSYQLFAQRRRDRTFDHAEVVLVDGSTGQVALRLNPGQPVSGRLLYDAELPADQRTQPTVELNPLLRTFGMRPLGAKVDEAGGFSLDGVPPGRYTVVLRGQPAVAYLDKILISGAAVPNREIVVGSEFPATDVQLQLKTDGATVQGKVKVGDDSTAEAPDGIAVLLPADYESGALELLAAYRQSDGMVQFNGVPPGRYHLFAAPRGNHFDLGSAEDRAYLRRKGTAVRVTARQNLQIDVPFVDNP